VQSLGVFIDTLVICTATALLILLSGVLQTGTEANGTQLTQEALGVHIGAVGPYFVAIAVLFFAFTSIIGNYAYAENALVFLGLGHRAGLVTLRIGVLAMVIWGAMESVATVFNAADASMGLMATINLVAILLLSGLVVRLARDYASKRHRGEEPLFLASEMPELAGQIDPEIWRRR
jgi:AGCS family alanine or glycine:cation symporter